MTSKNSYWKLSKMNLSRRVPYLVLCFLLCLILMPIVTYFECNMFATYDGYQSTYIIGTLATQIASGDLLQDVLVTILAVVFGITGNSWNNVQKKNDFYKSLPVKEKTRFNYIHINSYICFIICFGVNLIFSNCIIAMYGFYEKVFVTATLYSLFIHSFEFVAVYWVVVIAEYLTGNIILAICGTGVLLAEEPVLRFIIYIFTELKCKTYYSSYYGIEDNIMSSWTTPYAGAVRAYIGISEKPQSFSNAANYSNIWGGALELFVQCVVFGCIAYFIYNRRQAQGGNKNIVFEKTKPFIKGLVMIPSVAICTLFFMEGGSMISGIIGLVIGLVIGHIVLQFLIEGDFKAVKRGLVSSAVAGLVVAGVLIYFEAFGNRFDTYLPDVNEVESISIATNDEYQYNFYDYEAEYQYKMIRSVERFVNEVNMVDPQFIQYVLDIVSRDVENNVYSYSEDRDNYEDARGITISYNLKNGKRKVRVYLLPIEDVMNIRKELFKQPEYVLATNQLEDPDNKAIIEESKKLDIVYSNYGFSDYELCAIEDVATQKVMLEAITKDHNKRSGDVNINNFPVGEIRITATRPSGNLVNFSFPVYMSDINTIEVLKGEGFEPHEFDKTKIVRFSIDYYLNTSDYHKTINVGDEEFDFLLENCMIYESYYATPYARYDYNIYAYDANGASVNMSLLREADTTSFDLFLVQ